MSRWETASGEAGQRLPIPTWSFSNLLVYDWWLQKEKKLFLIQEKKNCPLYIEKYGVLKCHVERPHQVKLGSDYPFQLGVVQIC